MHLEDTDITPLEQIAQWVGEIWSECGKATHLLFRVTDGGEACGLRAVRRAGDGYIHLEKQFADQWSRDYWMFNDDLPWEKLATELEGLLAWDPECPALVKESGGWWRLGLGEPVAEAEVYQAYEAHTVVETPDAGAVHAERGKKILQSHLTAVAEGRRSSDVLAEHSGHQVEVDSSTVVTCETCRVNLTDQWCEQGNAFAVGGPLRCEGDVIDAVTALLHYADGWHPARKVLDRALLLLIKGQQMTFDLPDGGKHPLLGSLDDVAGAVAAYYATAARFHLTDTEVAEQAMERFQGEIEEHRTAFIKARRSATAGLTGRTS